MYIADGSYGLVIADTTSPTADVKSNIVGTAPWPTGWYPQAMYVAGKFAMASNDGLRIYDVSNPAVPGLAGQLIYSAPGAGTPTPPPDTTVGRVTGVAVMGHYAYLSAEKWA